MLRRCPHHGYDAGLRVSFFYEGLNPVSKQNLDSGVGGQVARIPLNEAEEAIDEVCRYYSWEVRPAQSLPQPSATASRLGDETTLRRLVQESVEKALSKQSSERHGSDSVKAMLALHCDTCGGNDHISSYCTGVANEGASVNAMHGGRPYGDWKNEESRGASGSYWRGDQQKAQSGGWRDQGQSSWSNQGSSQWRPQPQGTWGNQRYQQQGHGEGEQGGYKPQNRMPYQHPNSREQMPTPPPQPKPSDSLDAILQQLQKMNQTMEKQSNQLVALEKGHKEQAKHSEMLEKQLAQVASEKAMSSQNPLPAQPHPNPHGGGGTHGVHAIQLRSGTQYEGPERDEVDKSEEGVGSQKDDEKENEEEKNESEKQRESENEKKNDEGEKNEIGGERKNKSARTKPPSYDPKYEHPPPYPHRLVERKLGDKFNKFLEMMKGLQINMPFLQAISQMPTYAKFLKDLLSNKSKLEEAELVQLPHQISAMVERKMPKKYSDPGCFTLPVRIGDLEPIGALADLGAGVSLMPLCIAKKLAFEMVPSKKTIQLADRSIRVPDGQLIDIPIRVGHLVVPCDFIVMEMDPDPVTPLILGREALKTLGAMVNCKNNTITLEVADERMVFEFSKSMKQPMVPKICKIHMEDGIVEELSWEVVHQECELHGEEKKDDFVFVEGPRGDPGIMYEDAPDGSEKDFCNHPW